METEFRSNDTMPREKRMELIVQLFERAQDASEEEREHILGEIILLNRCVADSIAMRFAGRGVATEDLKQVAYEGLVKAVRRFDPTRDHDLLSYAVPTIRGEIRRHFRDHGWSVRPPRRVQELQQRISRVKEELGKELGRDPEVAEILEAAEIDRSEYDRAVEAYGSFRATSLDQPREPGGESTLGDLVVAEDTTTNATEARLALAPVVRNLPERDRRIIYLRFYEERTQAEIGEELGVTQMQVSRLLSGIFSKMREQVGEYPLG